MQEESRENKNAKRLNFLKGRQSRNPSQTNGGAKIQINSETAIPKLQNLAQKYIGATNPQGFLTDLMVALGIPDSQGASKYGVVTIPKDDGSILQASLRITNHQANAEQYIQHNANYEYNLSIVVKRKPRKNTFIPNDSVKLDEYVYYGTKMQEVENPLTQVIKGIISFLQSGEYKDTTGIAFKNQSPQPNTTENKQNINCNINMKKNRIKITESELKQIVEESVNKILSEAYGTPSKYTKHQYNILNGVENHYDGEKGVGRIFPKNKRIEYPTDSEKYSGSDIFAEIDRLNNRLIDTEKRWTFAMNNSTYTLTDKMARRYGYEILNNLRRAEKLSRRMMVLLKMQLGEQPDSNYFDNHKPSQDDGGYSLGGGREDRHDYSGLPGWGG